MFTSVDLPTPDEPTNATVCPGCSHGLSADRSGNLGGIHCNDGQRIGKRARFVDEWRDVVTEIGLGEHDHWLDVCIECNRKITLQSRWIEIVIA